MQAATASSPVASRADRRSIASSPKRSRRRRSARSIFGRSLPVEQVDRLELVRHRGQHSQRSCRFRYSARRRGTDEQERRGRRPRGDRRAREAADHPCAPDEIGGEPAVDVRDQRGAGGRERRGDRGSEREPEERRDDRRRERVRRHRVDGDAPELQPEDRRGRDPARERDREHLRQPRAAAGSRRGQSFAYADGDEDRDDRGERELEAGVEQVVRAPREEADGADEQEVPAVALPRRQPGERSKRTSDPRADHGRLGADSEHIRADPGERADMAEPARQPEQPGEAEHAQGDEDHVLAADREQVVEPGCRGSSCAAPGRALRPRRGRCPRGPRAVLPSARARRLARATPGRGRRSRRSRRGGRRSASRGPGRRRGRRAGRATFARRSRSRPAAATAAARGARSERPAAASGRPGGRASTGSLSVRSPKRVSRAGTRKSNSPPRAGPVTTASAASASPTLGSSTLESIASRRALPHHQPARSSATASSATRASGVGRERACECRKRRQPDDNRRTTARRIGEREPEARRRGERIRVVAQQPLGHGTTNPRSCSTREGPIPGTSSSSSTAAKRTVGSSVVDDLRRRHRADPGQRVELLGRRHTQLHRPDRAARHRRPLCSRDLDRQTRRHDELLAVGDGRRQIYAGRVRSPR